jgi:hypothetical protein
MNALFKQRNDLRVDDVKELIAHMMSVLMIGHAER